jgi:predicted Zn-dependent protease
MTSKYYSLSLTAVLLVLGGCMAPLTQPAAPVVDRSVYRQPIQPREPERPVVETVPLERPQPIIAEREPPVDPRPIERPQTTSPTPPQPVEPPSGQAVAALLDSAAGHVGSGNMDQAAGALERALRIEPDNATIWHDLGQIRLHQREFTQAESMFDKSNSLASGDRALRARNWRMIAVARRAGGDAAGAEAAEAQATVLER